MTDIILAGQRGQGKTLKLVQLAVKAYASGYAVVTNLKFTKIPYIKFDINIVYKAMNEDLDLNQIYNNDKIFLALDEITTLGDSRASLKTENIVLSYLFMQARKRGIDIGGTLQIFKTVDQRIRDLIEIKAKCYRIGTKQDPKAFYIKYKNQQTGTKWIKRWDINDARKYFEHYDTDQPINPQFLRKREKT